MNKIYLSAGHQKDGPDFGATSAKAVESVLADEFVQILKEACEEVGVTVVIDNPKNSFVQTLNYFASLVKPIDLALDIHFNSFFKQSANGTEVIIPENYDIDEFGIASKMLKIISEGLGTYSRGVKTEKDTPRKRLGWMRLKCQTILIEMCFISNNSDLTKYHDAKFDVAASLACYIESL